MGVCRSGAGEGSAGSFCPKAAQGAAGKTRCGGAPRPPWAQTSPRVAGKPVLAPAGGLASSVGLLGSLGTKERLPLAPVITRARQAPGKSRTGVSRVSADHAGSAPRVRGRQTRIRVWVPPASVRTSLCPSGGHRWDQLPVSCASSSFTPAQEVARACTLLHLTLLLLRRSWKSFHLSPWRPASFPVAGQPGHRVHAP